MTPLQIKEFNVKKRILLIGLVPALIALLGGAARPVEANDRIEAVTTLSVLRYIVEEVGGDRVEAHSLSNPKQDPHYVQPRPTLIKMARDADLFVEVGLQLELWGQKVVDGSGNPAIQSGQPGRVIASTGISTLELPEVLSREWGDIHPYGNPHIWLDPLNVRKMAENIVEGLIRVDPQGDGEYRRNLADFQRRIDVALYGSVLVDKIGSSKLSRLTRQHRLMAYLESRGLTDDIGGWLGKARPLAGEKLVTYHKTWIYFASRFGLEIPVEIEEKPGITPSAKHRDAVIRMMKKDGIKAIVIAMFYDRSAADYLARETGASVVVLPIDITGEIGSRDYFELMDRYLNSLLNIYGED